MHQQWSGKAQNTRMQKSTVKYVYPKEGIIAWMDNVAVPSTATNVEGAKKFLNFLMDPENIALEQASTGYQSAVMGSNKYLPRDLGNSPEFNPPADLKTVFASVPQIDKLRLTANSSPPGAKSGDVVTVSVIAQDGGGLLKELDQTAKRSLGEALLTAAGTAWPNASVSLLVSDPSGAGGQIIGSRGAGGPNTIIVS